MRRCVRRDAYDYVCVSVYIYMCQQHDHPQRRRMRAKHVQRCVSLCVQYDRQHIITVGRQYRCQATIESG